MTLVWPVARPAVCCESTQAAGAVCYVELPAR